MKLYARPNDFNQRRKVQLFRDLMDLNNDIRFFQPDPECAPWHVKAPVGSVMMNFWPHLLKGNIEGQKSVTGFHELRALIGRARQTLTDNIDLIERD